MAENAFSDLIPGKQNSSAGSPGASSSTPFSDLVPKKDSSSKMSAASPFADLVPKKPSYPQEVGAVAKEYGGDLKKHIEALGQLMQDPTLQADPQASTQILLRSIAGSVGDLGGVITSPVEAALRKYIFDGLSQKMSAKLGENPEQSETRKEAGNKVAGDLTNILALVFPALKKVPKEGVKAAAGEASAVKEAPEIKAEYKDTSPPPIPAPVSSQEKKPEVDQSAVAPANMSGTKILPNTGKPQSVAAAVTPVTPVAVAKPGLVERAKSLAYDNPISVDVRKVLAPTSLGKDAKESERIIRAGGGEQAAEYERSAARFEAYRKEVGNMPEAERYAFLDRIESRQKQPTPQLQALSDEMRRQLDDRIKKIRSLGKGQLEKVYDNYVAHIWKDPAKAEKAFGLGTGKRPLQGSKSFLKQRTVDTIAQGRARGLELITDNPLDLTLMKISEMDKYYHGTKIIDDLRGSGTIKFFKFGEERPEGWKRIDDPFARVYSPVEVEYEEAFDKNFRDGLLGLAERLGMTHERKLSLEKDATGLTKQTWGYARRDKPYMATKFGGPDFVIAHELGHLLDFRYGLADMFSKDAKVWKELEKLADLRSKSSDPQYRSYLRNPRERIANMVHAFTYSPELMNKVAPKAKAMFDQFIDRHPELAELHNIRTGLELKSNLIKQKTGEMAIRGEYYAPEHAARVINNFLSKSSLSNSGTIKAMRETSNLINSMQLSFSGFHAGFTSMEAMISKLSLVVKQAVDRNFAGALKSAGEYPFAAITNVTKGSKLMSAIRAEKITDPHLAKIVKGFERAGGRMSMDQWYKGTSGESFLKSIKNGTFMSVIREIARTNPVWKTPFKLLGKTIELSTAPIMEELVPRQKLGVFYDMASYEIKKNPNMTPPQFDLAVQKAWDSVDNRLGQMVYDNLFWNKTLKELAFLTTRSVGWNLGTIRELGGGFLDVAQIPQKGLSHRTAYVGAVTFHTALMGSIIMYLYTGHGPEEMLDYFYPRTGRKNADGYDERLSLPTYMKDIFAYQHDPVQTLANKANPWIGDAYDMLSNRDYFGAAIANHEDPFVKQLEDYALFQAKQIEPFSIKNVTEGGNKDMPASEKALNFVGVTPAPKYITEPERERFFKQREERKAVRKRDKMRAKEASQ